MVGCEKLTMHGWYERKIICIRLGVLAYMQDKQLEPSRWGLIIPSGPLTGPHVSTLSCISGSAALRLSLTRYEPANRNSVRKGVDRSHRHPLGSAIAR
jgi:hypothetical protein